MIQIYTLADRTPQLDCDFGGMISDFVQKSSLNKIHDYYFNKYYDCSEAVWNAVK